MKVQRKLKLGKDAEHTYWGRRGCAHGMYTGGYNYYVYGIRGIFNYIKLECWGGFRDMEI